MSKNNNNYNKDRSSLINKLSFFTIAAVSLLYLTAAILSILKVDIPYFDLVTLFQSIAIFIAMGSISVLAWKYAKSRSFIFKLMYFVFMIIVTVTIFIPVIPWI